MVVIPGFKLNQTPNQRWHSRKVAPGGLGNSLVIRRRMRLVLSMADDLDQRLEKLESHVAHLERQYEELNAVVIEQGRILGRIQKELLQTSRAVETMELERIKANNARPPHYGP